MKPAIKLLAQLLKDESGGELIEYVLIAGLIVAVALATITMVGSKLLGRWTSIQNSM